MLKIIGIRGMTAVSLICILTATWAYNAKASLIFEEDFNGYPAAKTNADDADPIGWNVDETRKEKDVQIDRVQIVNIETTPTPPVPHSEPNAVKIMSSTTGKSNGIDSTSLTTSGKEGEDVLIIDFWIYRADDAGTGFISVGAVEPEYNAIIGIYLYGNSKVLDISMKELAASELKTWERYKIAADSKTDTYDFYLNDMETPKKTGIPLLTPVDDWVANTGKTGRPTLWISQRESMTESVIYVDDVLMKTQ